MAEKNEIIHINQVNLGELTKPATVLVEKVSNAVAELAKPWQIVRVARAETEAEKIKTLGKIEITELEQRAANRLLAEETRKQANIETIMQKALPGVREDAKPQDMDDDWIVNFFDKCRLISDEEMQLLWARILAGEASKPGTFSRRTVNFVTSMDRSDASLFTRLCGFCWNVGDLCCPIIRNYEDAIYSSHKIAFYNLQHLDEIGLITFDNEGGFAIPTHIERGRVSYFGRLVGVRFKNSGDNSLPLGQVVFSRVGRELASIAGGKPVEGFVDYVARYWEDKGLTVERLGLDP